MHIQAQNTPTGTAAVLHHFVLCENKHLIQQNLYQCRHTIFKLFIWWKKYPSIPICYYEQHLEAA